MKRNRRLIFFLSDYPGKSNTISYEISIIINTAPTDILCMRMYQARA
jgi:hypothetical protein